MYAAASITDALDGKIARSRNLVTTFGKFADPLADKILVLAAFAAMADISTQMTFGLGSQYSLHVNGIVVTIIAAREFMVSGLRLVTAEKGVVVAAGIWGKLKTAFTMVTQVMILLVLCLMDFGVSLLFSGAVNVTIFVLVWISVALTVISGAVYLKGYWKYIDMK